MPPSTASRPCTRIVTWAVPAGSETLLGVPGIGGLCWLLGLGSRSEVVALILRRGLALDVAETGMSQ
jgi:hypothetical protein